MHIIERCLINMIMRGAMTTYVLIIIINMVVTLMKFQELNVKKFIRSDIVLLLLRIYFTYTDIISNINYFILNYNL